MVDEATGIGETVRELLENPDDLPSKKARPTSRNVRMPESVLSDLRRRLSSDEYGQSPSYKPGRTAYPSNYFG